MNYQPRKQAKNLKSELDDIVNHLIKDSNISDDLKILIKDFECYVCDFSYGYTRYWNNCIVIPLWAHNRSIEYFTYYIAHELAHALAYINNSYYSGDLHNEEFYNMFNEICPKKYQHFEYKYKPKNAKRFGVEK